MTLRPRILAALEGLAILAVAGAPAAAQQPALLLEGARILAPGGERFLEPHDVLVVDGRIQALAAAGRLGAPEPVRRIDLRGRYLIPGLIDLHTHLLLHPYSETSWNDQVLKESLELRTIRATVAARATLRAGFTTIRDLGTEGAGFADVALRDAIAGGLIEGPRVVAVTRALVATGCYGPAGFDPRWHMPKGAQVADGPDGVRRAVREQIAAGADWIKVYADYRRRPGDPSTPTYSQAELDAIVDEARSAGLRVAAHAVTPEAIRRCVRAGVATIEHGTLADEAALRAMARAHVTLCPTLAASWAMARYAGWNGEPPEPARVRQARSLVRRALAAGVSIACGSDAGVFAHGENAREVELLVACGLSPAQALRAATETSAAVLGRRDELGRIAKGHLADLVALAEDPLTDVRALRAPVLVVARGRVARTNDPGTRRR